MPSIEALDQVPLVSSSISNYSSTNNSSPGIHQNKYNTSQRYGCAVLAALAIVLLVLGSLDANGPFTTLLVSAAAPLRTAQVWSSGRSAVKSHGIKPPQPRRPSYSNPVVLQALSKAKAETAKNSGVPLYHSEGPSEPNTETDSRQSEATQTTAWYQGGSYFYLAFVGMLSLVVAAPAYAATKIGKGPVKQGIEQGREQLWPFLEAEPSSVAASAPSIPTPSIPTPSISTPSINLSAPSINLSTPSFPTPSLSVPSFPTVSIPKPSIPTIPEDSLFGKALDLSFGDAIPKFEAFQQDLNGLASGVPSNLRLKAPDFRIEVAQGPSIFGQAMEKMNISPVDISGLPNPLEVGINAKAAAVQALESIFQEVVVEELYAGLPQDVKDAIHDVQLQMSSLIESAAHTLHLEETITNIVPLAAGGLATVLGSILVVVISKEFSGRKASAKEGLPLTYDRERIGAYWRARPRQLLFRTATILAKFGVWLVAYYADKYTGKEKQNEQKRAKEICTIIVELGPAFIKIGQALSMRPDLFGPVYVEELQKLQDSVPAFSGTEAAQIVRDSLPDGVTPEQVFKKGMAAFIEPVAAASIGQVYKVELINDTFAAVKVQRPKVLESVTLDLFVVRSLLELGAGSSNEQIADSCEGFIGVIDDWASRFVLELDYRQEANNQVKFSGQIQQSKILQNVVEVPKVYDELTTQFVLVTEWIAGKKLSEIAADEESGKKVMSTLLNCYLAQLLDTGFLHADPHLGNFLLADDGKVVVLDYGLMTEVSEERRISLLEYVVHLMAKDYDSTLSDLVRLGFIPEEIDADPEKRAIVAPLLGSVLRELSKGGGAENLNLDEVGEKVRQLGDEYPIIIPAYFGLILRTFSSLEGAGLGVDKDYAIVEECFPYLSQRLLTDDSPRMREALKTFVYGKDNRLSVARVESILNGFSKFANTMKDSDLRRPNQVEEVQPLDDISKDTLMLLLSPNGNYVQELALDELTSIIDASSRNVALALLNTVRSTAAEGLSGNSLFGILTRANPIAQAILTQMESLSAEGIKRLDLTDEDKETIKVAEKLLEFVVEANSGSIQQQPNVERTAAQIQAYSPVVAELLPGVQSLSLRAMEKLITRLLVRFETPDVLLQGQGQVRSSSPSSA